jgi:hypothetical protein
MKIIAALFGRKKSTDAPGKKPSYLNAYVEKQLSLISTCISTAELTGFANDYSGYVREAAVARCVELVRPDLLPEIAP